MNRKPRGSKKRCRWCGKPTPRKIHPCGKASYATTCQSDGCNAKAKEYQKQQTSKALTGNQKHYDKRRKYFSAQCIVCGKKYSIRHNETGLSKPRNTCSDECLKEFRQKVNASRIKGYAANETNQQRIKRTEPMFNRTQTRPSVAMCPENANARSFVLIAPDGKCFEGRNVTNFVRSNPHLFTEYEMQLSKPRKKFHGYSVCKGTRQPICVAPLTAVLRGNRGSYHGWTGFYTNKTRKENQ